MLLPNPVRDTLLRGGFPWELAMTDAPVKTPWHIWVVGVVALLFSSIGVFDFVMSMAQGAEYQTSAGMTPDQIAHYQQMPSWMTVVWADLSRFPDKQVLTGYLPATFV